MTDTSGMVPAIESDRIGGPWVELWGDWLQRIYVPGVRRLCIGLYRDAARMGLARGVRPSRIYFYCIRCDVYRLA